MIGTGYNRLGIAVERGLVWDRYCTASIAVQDPSRVPSSRIELPRVDKIMYGTEKVLPEPSRETKFSGVHKDNCAARDLGARARADAISNGA